MAMLHSFEGAERANLDLPHKVHIGVDGAMSGVTRFTQEVDAWEYSKEETLLTGLLALCRPLSC